jgi:hypothetical protein
MSRRHHSAKQLGNIRWPWPSVSLIFPRWGNAECLAKVFLMDAYHRVPVLAAVVAVYDYRCHISEAGDMCAGGYQSRSPRSIQAQMLIEIVIVQACDGWFENMGCCCYPVGYPPIPST